MAPTLPHAAVVAIDFGTTRSGYRFAFTANPSKIYPNTTWEHAIAEGKTTTEVLLNRNDLALVAFGYEARNLYIGSAHKDNYLYFSNFKMTLHNSEGPIRSKVKATNCDYCISTELLISKCIGEIKDRAFRQLNESLSVAINYSQIRWVVTVPAIWDVAARQVMLDAAVKAGIDASNVVIAVEPEGAVLSCLENEISERSGLDIYSNNFIVVDAGGGTIDITVHSKMSDGRLAELHSPTGGNWGSSYINRQFEQLLAALFGTEYMKSIKGSANWIAVLDSFELAKVNYSPKHKFANIGISGILPDGFDNSKIAKYNAQHNTKLELNRGILRVGTVLQTFFDSSISSITAHIESLLQKPQLKQVKYMFLVGGYAESPMLQEQVKTKFGNALKVIIPPRPSAAVVNGAVRYGLNPSSIASRIAKHSIGIEHRQRWKEQVHHGRPVQVTNGQKFCTGCIWPFITIGESVDVGKEIAYSFEASVPTGALIPVYVSSYKDMDRVSDNTQRIGSLHLCFATPMPDAALDVHMKFGGTTFEVTTVCRHTGQSVMGAFTFNLDELPSEISSPI